MTTDTKFNTSKDASAADADRDRAARIAQITAKYADGSGLASAVPRYMSPTIVKLKKQEFNQKKRYDLGDSVNLQNQFRKSSPQTKQSTAWKSTSNYAAAPRI